MALDMIIGGCGSGKTHECIKRIVQLEKTAKNIIYIVPQQFTLETERMLLAENGRGAIMKTRVLSFHRLARVVMNPRDARRPVLSPLGRAFLVRRVVHENRDKLTYFSKIAQRQGFLDSLVNILTEFYQYSVTPEMLRDAAEKTDEEGLKYKLNDLYTIYGAYRSYAAQHYAAAEETLDILARDIGSSDYIKDAHIFIDGIDYFIPQEYEVIRRLMSRAANVTVTVCGGFREPVQKGGFDPFYEQKRTVLRLRELAAQAGIQANAPTYLSGCKRHEAHADMLHLFENYFKPVPAKFGGEVRNIKLVCAVDADAELEYVCRQINGLVRGGEVRYDDIAVITDSSAAQALKNKFAAYGIPVFMDSSRPAASHPLTELVLAVMDIVCRGINTRRMLRYAKSVFSPADPEDVYYLENYIIKHGIDGNAWLRADWDWGFADKEADEDYLIINTAKNELVQSLAGLRKNVRRDTGYSARHIINAFYDFLYELGADKTLEEMAAKAQEEGDLNAYRQHSRIWDELKNIFETLESIADREFDIAEFSEVFRSGLDMCGISIIPPVQDNVMVGDIDRSRLPDVKAVFITGASEGVIPPFMDDIGLLADRERSLLCSSFFEVAADNTRKINMIDLNIYSIMLKPSRVLYITRPLTQGGKRKPRSPVVTRLLKLFPGLTETAADLSDIPPAPLPAFNAMLKTLREAGHSGEISDTLLREYGWFGQKQDYAESLEMLGRVARDELSVRENTALSLGEAELKKLYNGVVYGSVSCLESYARCPFAYFLRYGLKIREREENSFDMLRLGNLFHGVLEDFSEGLKREGRDWRSLGRDEIRERVEGCVDGMIPEAFNDIMAADPHFIHTVERVKNIMDRSIGALCSHVRAGRFSPSDFEAQFGIGKELAPIVFAMENGSRIVLNGKIDRVDIMSVDKNDYVKIIDYKSSKREFSKTELYYGLQLQLLLYMDSYIAAHKPKEGHSLLPGGVFYFRVSNPMVEDNGDADIEKLVLEQYDMNGLVLDSSEVLDGIGKRSAKGRGEKIETLDSVERVSDEDFARLCADAEKIAVMLGGGILGGNVDINPSKCGTKKGCDYCGYASVCRFEMRENAAFRDKPLDGE
ncbi:MAG: PD-(D/E)XK nuclease family protein [Firmicutes bacterium]|nr:PD-(D/E)XK nuclease family protein [Bacillota bacterium]